ncbi:nucleotidyltransferase family protein [Rhodospirillum sp. A1_3_36]|uniref:nucleotidyltransferase family protein n=1 Tax=Rhodospirillum sp. A1_3_36 TaxID=3391666 RepID=UPI0039A51197
MSLAAVSPPGNPATSFVLRCLLDMPLSPPATEISDSIVDLARHHMIAGLVLERIASLKGTPRTDDLAEKLRKPAQRTATKSLRILDAWNRLYVDHLKPSGLRHLVVKGIALDSRYRGSIGARGCRDLDVLLSLRDIDVLLPQLLEDGYNLTTTFSRPSDRVSLSDHMRILTRLSPEVEVVSPQGVLIELHSSLDLSGTAFPTDQWLGRAVQASIGSLSIPTPPTADHFVYLCYHHSRHEWSRLHWLSDLHLLMTHPSFDPEEVRAQARVAGLSRLVTACMELPDRIRDSLENQPEVPGNSMARDLTALCLNYARPAITPPEQGRLSATTPPLERFKSLSWIFCLDWRIRDRRRDRLRLIMNALRPKLADYQTWPLALAWTPIYWIYRPIRFVLRLF